VSHSLGYAELFLQITRAHKCGKLFTGYIKRLQVKLMVLRWQIFTLGTSHRPVILQWLKR